MFSGLNSAIGSASYGLIDSLQAKDVGNRMKYVSADMGAADLVFRALENKAYKERLVARKDYLKDVMGEIDPTLAKQRAGRLRTGFSGRGRTALAASKARGGGDIAGLDVAREIRQGASEDWKQRYGRAGDIAETRVMERTGILQEDEMKHQEYMQNLALAENVYNVVSGGRIRAEKADAAHTAGLREVFAGWFSPA